MAILKIAKMGHPVLRQIAKQVCKGDLLSEPIQRLIDDMIETMREMDGAGIAAPQVHESLQIMMIELNQNPRYPDKQPVPLTILINPVIVEKSEEMVSAYEGCLSIDGIRALVPRHHRVVVEAMDREGNPLRIEDEGFLAIAIQHEMDHLEGKFFLEHVVDFSSLCHEKEYWRYHAQTSL